MAHAATVLLQLLERVDADRLDVLLDPHVMEHLLEQTGSRDDAARALAGGDANPGTLLLSMLDAHTVDELWAMVPEELREHAQTKAQAQVEQAKADEKKNLPPLVLGLVGAILPTMIALGTFPEWGTGVSFGGVMFALVVSGAAGAWGAPEDRLAAAIACGAGSVMSVFAGSFLAPYVGEWFRFGVFAALAPGALVMGAVWLALTWHRRNEPRAF